MLDQWFMAYAVATSPGVAINAIALIIVTLANHWR